MWGQTHFYGNSFEIYSLLKILLFLLRNPFHVFLYRYTVFYTLMCRINAPPSFYLFGILGPKNFLLGAPVLGFSTHRTSVCAIFAEKCLKTQFLGPFVPF